MKKIKSIYLGCFLLLAFSGCGKKINTLNDFSSYISELDNGFKVCKSVNGVLVSVLYLPPEYLALKELTGDRSNLGLKYDSLLNFHRNSSSFIITFGPDEAKNNNNDIMFDNIKNFSEYTERSMELNFDLESKVVLKTKSGEYAPVLSSLENTYGLSKDRKVNLVFATNMNDDLTDNQYYDFVYSDETFGVGTLHFNFDKEALEKSMPEISIN